MADGEERWELAVTVPPVTEEINRVLVRCGRALVVVEPRDGDGLWEATESAGNYARGPGREVRDEAVADARRLALKSERHRLLDHALVEAINAEDDGGEVQ